MYILGTLISQVNKVASPHLLRYGLSLRSALGTTLGASGDNLTLDSLCFLPVTQKIISIEVQDDTERMLAKARKAKEEESSSSPSGATSKLRSFGDRVYGQFFGGADLGGGEKAKSSSNAKPLPATTKPAKPHPRLEVLEGYVRPALLPTGRWEDCLNWRTNQRFVRWLRREVLLAKHHGAVSDALAHYPSLRFTRPRRGILGLLLGRDNNDDGESIRKRDRLPLPSASEVVRAFSLQRWNRDQDKAAEATRMGEIANALGGSLQLIEGGGDDMSKTHVVRFPSLPGNCSMENISLEDVIELAGGHVAHCGALNAYCEEASVNEVLTKDYISELALYLLGRSLDLGGDVLVLEVGAGDGTLAHFLREFMLVKTKKRRNRASTGRHGVLPSEKVPEVIATDDGSWNIAPRADVAKMDVQQALEAYSQKGKKLIVLCSWMPMGEDWTGDFRDSEVDEYILIGESDDGNCGDNWETWGNRDFMDPEDVNDEDRVETRAPYLIDGYERVDLNDLGRLQYSRFDSNVSRSSNTVSFRKKGKV